MNILVISYSSPDAHHKIKDFIVGFSSVFFSTAIEVVSKSLFTILIPAILLLFQNQCDHYCTQELLSCLALAPEHSSKPAPLQ